MAGAGTDAQHLSHRGTTRSRPSQGSDGQPSSPVIPGEAVGWADTAQVASWPTAHPARLQEFCPKLNLQPGNLCRHQASRATGHDGSQPNGLQREVSYTVQRSHVNEALNFPAQGHAFGDEKGSLLRAY